MSAATATSSRARKLGVHAGHDSYKWWALSCTSLGMLLATINSGTLIIALPDLERSLHTSLLELVWVILVYMIASTVLVLSAGRLSDQFGRKKAYIGGFVLFAVASLGAGFADNGTQLILWRILQGIAGSFLFANSAAIVTDAFPREQLGMAMGTNTMVAAIGLVIGPVLGGALVLISWHWVFWFNVPFALGGSLWAWMILHEVSGRSEDRSFDALGTITFLIGLTGLVYGISKGGLSGWDSTGVIVSLAAAAVFLPGFVLIESRVRSPMLDLSIFKNRLFAAASLAAFMNGLARFALMFVFVFYFQGVQGNSPILAGVKLAPLALGMLVASPLAGIWADRRGSRGMAVAGMLVQAVGLALMTTLQRDTAYLAPGAYMLIVGIGSGMFNSPNTAAMMGTVPPHRRGIAAGARVLVQNTGAVISIAFVLAVVTSSVPKSTLFAVFSGLANHITNAQLVPFMANMHTALWCLAAISLLGAVVCAARPSHSKAEAELTESRRREEAQAPHAEVAA
ncbi:MAG TPA: MFS transporter [Solirubrobacteraceae bacterium]